MTVYADLLFIVNLYIDALLLSAVRRFLRLPLTGKRLLLASVLGGVFGLSALLPALPGVVLFPLALLESLALTEPFSGTPAIVADRRALGVILPPNFGMQSTENAVSMRLIPFSSLGADGVLPAFRPDTASLSGISIECWVAVTDRTLSAGSFQALVGAAVCDAAQIQGLKPGKDIP